MKVYAGQITIDRESADSSDAWALMDRLSARLQLITGDSGRSSFGREETRNPAICFTVAGDETGAAIGGG